MAPAQLDSEAAHTAGSTSWSDSAVVVPPTLTHTHVCAQSVLTQSVRCVCTDGPTPACTQLSHIDLLTLMHRRAKPTHPHTCPHVSTQVTHAQTHSSGSHIRHPVPHSPFLGHCLTPWLAPCTCVFTHHQPKEGRGLRSQAGSRGLGEQAGGSGKVLDT